jgi:transposase-like protein
MAPKRIITDKLGSYGAAKMQVMPMVEHRSHKGLNNRAENSHVPFRKRERVLQYFRLARAVQRFVSIFSDFRNFFVPPRYKLSGSAFIRTGSTPSLSGKSSPLLAEIGLAKRDTSREVNVTTRMME